MVETGIVDFSDITHAEILFEEMVSCGLSERTASKVINDIRMEEGKYPERQAYNKEGWLVTFPSKEYKDIAIKRGTHFGSDPTHGQGGMNLYYKRRGKQKRNTQQDLTATEEPVPNEKSSPPPPSR